jgi:hypothetical protein
MNPQTTYTFIQACQPIPNFQIIHRNNIIEDLIRYADFIDAPPLNTTNENTKQLAPKK